MSVREILLPWDQQPPLSSPVTAEFAPYLCSLRLGGSNYDSVLGTSWGGNNRGVGVAGPEAGVWSTSEETIAAPVYVDRIVPVGTEATFVIVVGYDEPSPGPNFSVGAPGSAAHEFNLYLPYSGDSNGYFRWGGSTDGSTSIQGQMQVIPGAAVVVSTGPNGMQLWQAGRLIASTASVPSRSASPGDRFLQCGSGAYGRNSYYALFSSYRKQFDRETNRRLSLDPWQLFEPQRIYVPALAGPPVGPTFYWIVQPAAAPTPTGAQIIAGQSGTGATAVASGTVADTGQESPVTAAVVGLVAGTDYEVAWVHSGNPYNVIISAFQTTGGAVGAALAGAIAALSTATAALTTYGPAAQLFASISARSVATAVLAARKAIYLVDGFDVPTLDTDKWLVTVNGATVGVANKRLRVALDAGGGKTAEVFSKENFDLTESELVFRVWRSTYPYFSLRFITISGQISWEVIFDATSLRAELYQIVAGITSVTYNAAAHAWFRFRSAGDTAYIEYAPETASNPPIAGDWTVLKSGVNAAKLAEHSRLGGGRLRIYAYEYNSGASATFFEVDAVNTSIVVADTSLAASVSAASTATAGLTVGVKLAAAAAAASTVSGALSASIRLSASAGAVSTATGTLTVGVRLAASVSATSTTTGALTTAVRLATSVAAVSTTAGALSTSIQLGSNIAALSTTSGTLTSVGAITLNATVAAVSTTTGAISASIRLATSVAGNASASATLTSTTAALAASVGAVSTATGAILVGRALVASAAAVSTATANLTVGASGGANALAQSTATGTLTTAIKLASVRGAVSSVSGTLTTDFRLGAAVAARSTASASLVARIQLNALAKGEALARGSLETQTLLFGIAKAQAQVQALLSSWLRVTGAARDVVVVPMESTMVVEQESYTSFVPMEAVMQVPQDNLTSFVPVESAAEVPLDIYEALA